MLPLLRVVTSFTLVLDARFMPLLCYNLGLAARH
jgi:hypothetical protein